MNKALRPAVSAGNWKMNNTRPQTRELLEALTPLVAGAGCQVVVCTPFTDLEAALALTAGLGGGIGRLRETCGAVLGMALALSLARAGDWEKGALYQAEQELVGRFRREQGSLLCRELLGEAGRDRAARPSPRTPAYYAARPCPRLVERAAQLLEDYLAEHPPACPPRLPGG